MPSGGSIHAINKAASVHHDLEQMESASIFLETSISNLFEQYDVEARPTAEDILDALEEISDIKEFSWAAVRSELKSSFGEDVDKSSLPSAFLNILAALGLAQFKPEVGWFFTERGDRLYSYAISRQYVNAALSNLKTLPQSEP